MANLQKAFAADIQFRIAGDALIMESTPWFFPAIRA
jgi:hypothetical protein